MQWWLPAGERSEFSAIGGYNQYVYADPSRGIVIVKLPANPRCGLCHDDADNKGLENILAFRAICQQFERLRHRLASWRQRGELAGEAPSDHNAESIGAPPNAALLTGAVNVCFPH